MKFSRYLLAFFFYGAVTTVQGEPTYVVSHLSGNCSPADQNRPNHTGANPTFAKLANHPKASLPSSFAICSMAMVPQCTAKETIQFFALLDENGENFLSAFLFASRTSFRLNVRENPYIPLGAISTVFPEQWVKRCLAVQTKIGRLKWMEK